MDADELAPARPPRRLVWVAGCALILSGIGALAAWGLTRPGSLSFYVTPAEVAGRAPGESLRIGGRVADLERDGSTVRFAVTDGGTSVPVRYTGEIPDTLREGTDVVAEGPLHADGAIEATRVLAKCSSKYSAKVQARAPQRDG